jgi:RHS repeat-associated protein
LKSYLAFRDYGLCFGPVTNSIDNVSITPLNTENGEFTGKKFEPDTGLVYFGGRVSDPETGRFMSQDPAKQGLNYYTYCGNNPLGNIDPDGRYYEVTASWAATGWTLCLADGSLLIGEIIYVGGEIALAASDTWALFGDKIVGAIQFESYQW